MSETHLQKRSSEKAGKCLLIITIETDKTALSWAFSNHALQRWFCWRV